jgi:hypothetical protein
MNRFVHHQGTAERPHFKRGEAGTGLPEPRGQVLVIVALSIVVLVAMVGVVIDGGFAWGRQRETQNAADAVAKAGTVVVQHAYGDDTSPTDGDVGCAVERAAAAFGVELVSAVYTNSEGTPLDPEVLVGPCSVGGGAAIPTDLDAQGVKATTEQEFDTFLARVVGVTTFTATADATAVVAPQLGVCPAGSGCGVLPVTFPLSAVYCDGTNSQVSFGSGEWEIIDKEDAIPDNLAIIPLCSTTAGTESPGSVGWLDYGCGNLSYTISTPCNVFIPIPAWVTTQTGNVNSVEDELNDWGGNQPDVAEFLESDPDRDTVLPLPIHNNTCESDPDGPSNDAALYTPDCPEGDWTGVGSNTYYHIPYWVGFMLDQAYVQGNNQVECNSPPGFPSGVAGSGATSCLKGWFVEKYESPGTMGTGDLTPGEPRPFGVLLVE